PFGLRSGGRPRCRGARPMDAASLFAPLLADRARQNATQAIGIRKGHALMAAGIQHTSSRGRGRMRRRAMAEINVTPFVDVMLVLLIVFMVTAPLLTVGVPVDLPKTKAANGYDQRIFVRGDARTNYGKVMEVMGLLAAAGFTHIGLVTDVVKPK